MPGNGSQEIHSKADPLRIPSRNPYIPGIGSTACQNDTVISFLKHGCTDICSHIDTCHKPDTCFFHQSNASVNDGFVQLHIRNAVPKQPSDPVLPLIDCDFMTPAI